MELIAALDDLDGFSEGASFWSWGKDEFNALVISCYVANISPPIPATRFDNACKLLLRAGMPRKISTKSEATVLLRIMAWIIQN